MYIYLLKSADKYKIGLSKQPYKRVKQLQTGNANKIQLIHKFETEHSYQLEKTFHNIYQINRKMGEWFVLPYTIEKTFLDECNAIEKNITILKELGNKFI